jgi:hypothetical protein
MKKLNVVLALMVVAVFALLPLSSQKAYADTVTLTLDPNLGDYTQYSWTNNGTHTELIGPYIAILNGDGFVNESVQVICYDMTLATQIGTAYSGSIEPLSYFTDTTTNTEIMEATYLGNKLINDGGLNASLATRGAISTAIWQIMNATSTSSLSPFPNDPAAQNYINDAIVAVNSGAWTVAEANMYATWVPNAGDIELIQRFDVLPAPEPGSLILLGTGMFGLATFMYRRKRIA